MKLSTRVAPATALEGVVSLLLTPFKPDKSIDWHAYDTYVEWQVSHRPTGLFAVCGTSEMKWLEPDERLALARRAVERAGEAPVITTANLDSDPDRHRDEVRRMAETGVHGIVLTPRPEFAKEPERYRDYLLQLIEASPCPVSLYEWPQVDDHLMSPRLFAEIAPFVTGIKDTTCTIEGIDAKLRVAGQTIVYQANTPFLLDALEAGARGIMAVTSAANADLVLRFWQSYRQKTEDRHALHRELVALDSLLRLSYPATAKHVAARRGLPMPVTSRWPGAFTPEMAKALDVWLDGFDQSTG